MSLWAPLSLPADMSALVDISTLRLSSAMSHDHRQVAATPPNVKELQVFGSLGMELAQSGCHETKKGGENMRIATAFVAALLFTGALGALNNAKADDGVILQQELTPASYCHMKFAALDGETVPDDQPNAID